MRAMTLALPALIEAVLFASGEPVNRRQLAELLGVSDEALVEALKELNHTLEHRGLALLVNEKEVELRTAAGAAPVVKKFRESELSRDLGKASLETLAIILYRGSATRGDIDWVRGVNSSTAIRSLLLRGLIEKTEDETDRRRARYHPTLDALGHLGVSERSHLPRYKEFTAALAAQKSAQDVAATSE